MYIVKWCGFNENGSNRIKQTLYSYSKQILLSYIMYATNEEFTNSYDLKHVLMPIDHL